MTQVSNLNPEEIANFDKLADRWWDPKGPCAPLHVLNPVRGRFITAMRPVANLNILDVGCGGGLLSEYLAQQGAKVTAIDAAPKLIEQAKQHASEGGLQIDYHCTTLEAHLQATHAQYDMVTCMEMIEHVPDPAALLASCRQALAANGQLFLSTLNRNLKSFLLAIVMAEYVLNLLPKGTHDYQQFITPAELAKLCSQTQLAIQQVRGIQYLPFVNQAWLTRNVSVNYIACATAQC